MVGLVNDRCPVVISTVIDSVSRASIIDHIDVFNNGCHAYRINFCGNRINEILGELGSKDYP